MNDDATIVVERHTTKPKHRSIHLNLNATNILIELAKDNRIATILQNDNSAKVSEIHCTIRKFISVSSSMQPNGSPLRLVFTVYCCYLLDYYVYVNRVDLHNI